MITLVEFYNGRDKIYAKDLTEIIKANAIVTLSRVNEIVAKYYELNPQVPKNNKCNSGWRPPSVNAATPGASKLSNHMLGMAMDVSDDGRFAKWLMSTIGLLWLAKIGLWMEHPKDTPTWCHLQTVSPKSGNRVYYAK